MAGSMRLSLIINADGTAAIQGINRVRDSLTEVGRVSSRVAGGGLNDVVSQLKSLAVTAASAVGVSSLASSFMAANRAAGTLRASLQTVMGSVEGASLAWEALQGFANATPYTLDQTVKAFIRLKSAGLDPSIAALTSYGNTAGATGNTIE